MKKILFYIPFIKIGGLEQVAMEYLKLLIRKGYTVDLIIDFDLGEQGNSFLKEIPEGVDHKFIKSQRVSKFIYTLRTLGKKYKIIDVLLYGCLIASDLFYYHSRTKSILKKGKYDCTISFYQFLPAHLTGFRKTNHIIWLHGSVEHFFSGITKPLKVFYEYKLKKYDYIVAVAEEMRIQLTEFYPALPAGKIKMIYNPFDLEKIRNKSDDFEGLDMTDQLRIREAYICTVTRIDENQKDIETLIIAYGKLIEAEKIHEKLYIIGEGRSLEYLLNLVTSMKLEQQVLFLGKKSNPFIWMKNARIFILSSKFEGFGMVLVEAMAVNTYVIASNCKTGPAEILDHGDCGDLFETGDAERLADLIDTGLQQNDYRTEKIEKANIRIREFSNERSLEQLVSLIETEQLRK